MTPAHLKPCTAAKKHEWTFDGGTAELRSGKVIHRERCIHCHARRSVYTQTGRIVSR